MKPGDPCIIHYAKSNLMPDPKWRDREGIVKVISPPGRHPRNILVETVAGLVVVPRWNCRVDSANKQLNLF